MDRRTFAGCIVAILSVRNATHAQQAAVATIGFLRSTPAEPFAHLVVAFRRGLREAGFVEGQNVIVDYRWAGNDANRLRSEAADLVRGRVAVIVGNSIAAEAAKAATSTIPIVFVTSDDPVTRGLVASLGRPDGNVTGITFFGGGQLGSKRLELLRELVPQATTVAFLMDPNWPASAVELQDVQGAARALGLRIVAVKAASAAELPEAFASVEKTGARAMVVGGSPVFSSERRQLVMLAARHAIPAIYDVRDHVDAGGLMSYGASFSDAYRQAGVYAGRILRGARPAELPVLRPTAFELVINVTTAEALGLMIPQLMLLRADELVH